MKKRSYLVTFLMFSCTAGASLTLTINGQIIPDGQWVDVCMSDILAIDLWAEDQPADLDVLILVDGVGSVALGPNPYNLVNPGGYWEPSWELLEQWELSSAVVYELWAGGMMPDGFVAGGTLFHCEGIGDMPIVLVNLDTFEVIDTVLVREVPEPASVALLALGGLLLRRHNLRFARKDLFHKRP